MTLVPAGSFLMGDSVDNASDAATTNVYVSAFYADTNLVSYSVWQQVYNYTVSHGYGLTMQAMARRPTIR